MTHIWPLAPWVLLLACRRASSHGLSASILPASFTGELELTGPAFASFIPSSFSRSQHKCGAPSWSTWVVRLPSHLSCLPRGLWHSPAPLVFQATTFPPTSGPLHALCPVARKVPLHQANSEHSFSSAQASLFKTCPWPVPAPPILGLVPGGSSFFLYLHFSCEQMRGSCIGPGEDDRA